MTKAEMEVALLRAMYADEPPKYDAFSPRQLLSTARILEAHLEHSQKCLSRRERTVWFWRCLAWAEALVLLVIVVARLIE
jgi:hypothetical protein